MSELDFSKLTDKQQKIIREVAKRPDGRSPLNGGFSVSSADRLVDKGWLDKRHSGRRVFYKFTPAGRAAYEAATQPTPPAVETRVPSRFNTDEMHSDDWPPQSLIEHEMSKRGMLPEQQPASAASAAPAEYEPPDELFVCPICGADDHDCDHFMNDDGSMDVEAFDQAMREKYPNYPLPPSAPADEPDWNDPAVFDKYIDRYAGMSEKLFHVEKENERLAAELAAARDELHKELDVAKAFHDVAVADDKLHIHQRDSARAELEAITELARKFGKERDDLAARVDELVAFIKEGMDALYEKEEPLSMWKRQRDWYYKASDIEFKHRETKRAAHASGQEASE